jgi:hypothetical protein
MYEEEGRRRRRRRRKNNNNIYIRAGRYHLLFQKKSLAK